jgi:hypothetical protein
MTGNEDETVEASHQPFTLSPNIVVFDPTDPAVVERVARALHEVEFGAWSPELGMTSHNRHTWPNASEFQRDTFRTYARAALAALAPNPQEETK